MLEIGCRVCVELYFERELDLTPPKIACEELRSVPRLERTVENDAGRARQTLHQIPKMRSSGWDSGHGLDISEHRDAQKRSQVVHVPVVEHYARGSNCGPPPFGDARLHGDPECRRPLEEFGFPI